MGQIKLSEIKEISQLKTIFYFFFNHKKKIKRFYSEGICKYKYMSTIQKGQMFGELGLIMEKRRAATIITKENTEFAVLD